MSPRRLLAMARKETIHIRRDPRSLGLAAGIPMLMLLMFGYALTLDVNHVPFVVRDQSGTPESRALVARFTATRYFNFQGAIADEAPWDDILQSNIIGAYNVWEAAYRNGVKRVVYASSVHAVGMHLKTDTIGLDAPHKPDTYYGLAKCFAEDLASLYWDKRGVEAVCLRIFSAAPPSNARAIGTWLSTGDLIHLVERAIDSPVVGFTTIYGISNNDRAVVDNSKAGHLGFRPKDNAEDFAKDVFAKSPPVNNKDPMHLCIGGPFASISLGESGVAQIKKMNT